MTLTVSPSSQEVMFFFWTLFLSILHLSASQGLITITAEPGHDLYLPCRAGGDEGICEAVKWSRSGLESGYVFLFRNNGPDPDGQNPSYQNRADLQDRQMKNGDVSLLLKDVTPNDTGTYECRVFQRGGTEYRATVHLEVSLPPGSLPGLVEVCEGMESVLLPCKYSGFIPEDDPKVMWTRSDISPRFVHQRGEDGDLDQNQRYRGRTSMRQDALYSQDFSLTLRKPRLSDSSTYTCQTFDGKKEVNVTAVELKVKDQQVKVAVTEGAESIILPCRTPDLPKDVSVEWTRIDPGFMMVHVHPNTSRESMRQNEFYRDRTEMRQDLLTSGDVSLTLKQPTVRDDGSYICTVHRDKDILRQKVLLQVKAPFPSWATVLLVLVPLLLVSAAVLYYFRHYFRSVPEVEVESGAKSVRLPCKTLWGLRVHRVEWKDDKNRTVHVYQNGSDQPGEQDEDYISRTEMNRNPLQHGDLSLTLKHPIDRDSQIYTCRVSSRKGNILMVKQVLLIVRVPQVEVESGAKSVVLPWKTEAELPADRVEWRNIFGTVHVYQNGSDQPGEQHQIYISRTEMNRNPLQPEDLSLTLKLPSDIDSGIYTCRVYNKEGKLLMKKQVKLIVRVPQVEVKSGTEAVVLPWKMEAELPADRVEWRNIFGTVHEYQNGSDQPEEQQPGEQHKFYISRTKMNRDPLQHGDLSLTLKHPTDDDSGIYICRVYNKEGNILMKKQVKLRVRALQVEVEEGAESVLLPFITLPDPDADTVTWLQTETYKMVHVYQNGSDESGEQDQDYRNRTKMKPDALKTGDFSLTLRRPTCGDSGLYLCGVGRGRGVFRGKRVRLNVRAKLRVQQQTENDAAIPLTDQSV